MKDDEHAIAVARDLWADGDLNIYDKANVDWVDGDTPGCWVEAYVWVPYEEFAK